MHTSRIASVCYLIFRQLPLWVAALLLAVGVAINFANAIGRYVFDAAIFWAEEAMIYLAIWSIFLAAVAVAYDRAELSMDFFSASLSRRWKRVVDGITTAATVLVCVFMATQSIALLRTLIRNGQNSVALEVPMALPQASLTFGFLMIAAAVTARFFLHSEPALPADETAKSETSQ